MTVVENVYLYRFKSHGELLRDIEVYEGKVFGPRASTYRFMCEGGFDFACSKKEGELLYGNFWLTVNDIDKAKEMFIKNQQEKIEALKKQIADIEYDIWAIQ